MSAPCEVETSYYCVRIDELDQDAAAGPALRLVLDRLLHTRVNLLDPTRLTFSYVYAYAEVTALTAARDPGFRALMIGGGGYGLPRYLEAVYPESELHVFELDPRLTEISHRRLGLRRDTRIRSHHGDARALLMGWSEEPAFDLVYGDAFNDLAMPFHLTTVEFVREIERRLTDDGVYMANVIDHVAGHGDVARSFVRTFRQVFPHVYLLRWGPYNPEAIETLVVAGTKRPLDLTPFVERWPVREQPGRRFSTQFVRGAELDAFVAAGRGVVLTDDYAPVDQLTAPLYALRGD
jgi:spermidine synthase